MKQYVSCGWKTIGTFPRRCNLWYVCPYCAFQRKQDTLRVFGDSFFGKTFDFITISLHQDIYFGGSRTGQLHHFWNGFFNAFESLFTDGTIYGAFVTSEILIGSFFNGPRILPHAHAVVNVEKHLRPDVADQLTRFVADYTGPNQFKYPTTASVLVKPINDEFGFFRTLEYCTKSLDLMAPYRKDFAATNAHPESVRTLNRHFKNFVEEYRGIIQDFKKVRYFGSMMGQCNSFIGQREERRNQTLKTVIAKKAQYKAASQAQSKLKKAA